MLKKRVIKICLGSSCFARGNNDHINIIKTFIRKNCIEDKVVFIGDHCFQKCIEGPNLQVNGKIFHSVNPEKIQNILKEELSDII